MLGLVVEFILQGILALTITAAVGGIFIAMSIRKGVAGNIDRPLYALSLIASTAPYIGLFGTVWHIIQALAGIGAGNLNVAAIAQPIGEALYATLWGLGCAIPALISHKVILYLLPDTSANVAE